MGPLVSSRSACRMEKEIPKVISQALGLPAIVDADAVRAECDSLRESSELAEDGNELSQLLDVVVAWAEDWDSILTQDEYQEHQKSDSANVRCTRQAEKDVAERVKAISILEQKIAQLEAERQGHEVELVEEKAKVVQLKDQGIAKKVRGVAEVNRVVQKLHDYKETLVAARKSMKEEQAIDVADLKVVKLYTNTWKLGTPFDPVIKV